MQNLLPVIEQRQNALRALLIFTLPGAALFGAINLQYEASFLALLDLVLFLVSLGILIAMRRNVALEPLALAYLVILFINIFATLLRADIHVGASTWLLVLPVLPYLLLRERLALPVAGGSLLAVMAAYLSGAEAAPHRLELLRLAHVLTPALGLFVVSHFYARYRVLSEEKLLERIFTDPLTGLGNRRKLAREFEREKQQAQRTETPLALLLIDLDHFKQLNDRYGHHAGDAALVFVARLLENRLREMDLPCRIGGEEFVVLLPATDATGAVTVAEELRQALETSGFRYRDEHIRMTLSAGVVELGQDGDDWPHLYRTADAYLYACKERGRNCILSHASRPMAIAS